MLSSQLADTFCLDGPGPLMACPHPPSTALWTGEYSEMLRCQGGCGSRCRPVRSDMSLFTSQQVTQAGSENAPQRLEKITKSLPHSAVKYKCPDLHYFSSIIKSIWLGKVLYLATGVYRNVWICWQQNKNACPSNALTKFTWFSRLSKSLSTE